VLSDGTVFTEPYINNKLRIKNNQPFRFQNVDKPNWYYCDYMEIAINHAAQTCIKVSLIVQYFKLSVQYITIQYKGYDFTPKFRILTQNDNCKSTFPWVLLFLWIAAYMFSYLFCSLWQFVKIFLRFLVKSICTVNHRTLSFFRCLSVFLPLGVTAVTPADSDIMCIYPLLIVLS